MKVGDVAIVSSPVPARESSTDGICRRPAWPDAASNFLSVDTSRVVIKNPSRPRLLVVARLLVGSSLIPSGDLSSSISSSHCSQVELGDKTGRGMDFDVPTDVATEAFAPRTENSPSVKKSLPKFSFWSYNAFKPWIWRE